MKDIIESKVIAVGVSGWMADFGESLPMDSSLYLPKSSGGTGMPYHNKYPEEWARQNQEAVSEANRTGDIVFFHQKRQYEESRFVNLVLGRA